MSIGAIQDCQVGTKRPANCNLTVLNGPIGRSSLIGKDLGSRNGPNRSAVGFRSRPR
jgi:hypothetical protein